MVFSTMLRRLYPDLWCHCLLPCLARDRIFRFRSLVLDVARLNWACLSLLIEMRDSPAVFMGMCIRWRRGWPSVTERAAGQPSGQHACDGQAHGDERIREVTFRPVCRPHGRDGAALSARQLFRPRGEKTWSARRR